MMRALFTSCLLLTASTFCAAEDWTGFRGPQGSATDDAARPPVTWSATSNIRWKAPLIGRGASSPVVYGDRIFLTAYTGYGIDAIEPGNKSDLRLHVLCLARGTGELLWTGTISGSAATQEAGHRVVDHGFATATPVVDDHAVYASFGVSGLVAFDHSGAQLWLAELGSGTAGFGSASSPVLHGELVIVNASIESDSLLAFDRGTGRQVWKAEGINRAWTTPCIAELEGGQFELVLNHKDEILGFDPATGKKLWWCAGIQDYVVPVPIVHDGIAYCLGGRSNRAIAVKLGGRDDVTKTHKLWEVTTGANVTSPVYFDGRIYWASDKAIQCCLNAGDGEVVYQERLPTRARIYASIIRAGNHFYVTTRDQGVVVLAAEPEYREVAVNVIETDETLVNASPIVSGDELLLRTDAFLYCIGDVGSNN